MAERKPDLWESVRRCYEASELTVAEIAAISDCSESAIYQRARREGWTRWRRPGVSPRRARHHHAPPTAALSAYCEGEAAAGGAAERRRDRKETAEALWRAVDRQLRDIETLGLPEGDIQASRVLNTMAGTLRSLVKMEVELAEQRAREQAHAEEEWNPDEMLAELARRIEAMDPDAGGGTTH